VRRIRVIPTLLMSRSRNGLVKGTRFRDHVYIGDPINAVKVFNDKGVDEIAILDIDATREKRGPDLRWIEEVCGEAFMPLAYGGGIASVEQAKEVLRRGAEKVIVNASALRSLDFVREAAKVLGSQSIVVSIDVKRTLLSGQRVFGACGTTDARIDPTDFAVQVAAAGAGEILLTSIDREGTLGGYDIELLRRVTSVVRIPVIASGGAGTVEHFVAAVRDGGASAVAAGSMFVFMGRRRGVLLNYPSTDELQRFFRSA